MKKLILFAVVLLCNVHTLITAQTADEILTKHFEAIGGKDKVGNIKTIKMTGNIELQAGLTAPVSIQIVNNKSMRFDLSIQGMTMNQVVDGETGWQIMPFQGNPNAEPIPADQIKEMKGQMDVQGDLFNYKEKGNTVDLVGNDEVDGTEVYKLKVTTKDGRVNYKYIDKASNYIIKEVQIVKTEDKEVEGATVFSNFKKTDDGITFPFNMNTEMAGGVIKWEKIEINPTIDPTIFKMPAKN